MASLLVHRVMAPAAVALVSPHSGHTYPLDRRMFVHYRRSRQAWGVTGELGRRYAGRRMRPYAEYAGDRGAISMIFSDGHPHSCRTSLFYMRMRGGRFYRIGGGRAWPMDVAFDRRGSPVVVYTRSSLHGDRSAGRAGRRG